MSENSSKRKTALRWSAVAATGIMGLTACAMLLGARPEGAGAADVAKTARLDGGRFQPSPAQRAALTILPVEQHAFRTEQRTEGKIAVDEDRSTPIFSPYAGRVLKLLVAPGDRVQRGQPLFVLEASDSVQAQNDFVAALAGVNKSRSQVSLAGTVERRQHTLYESKAAALKDWQQAQADLTVAQNDQRMAQATLDATRNRLRILGKTDAEIDTFERTRTITADSTVYAPLSGTIVQRKVGPGQYVAAGSSDPVFVIGDLSTVWLVAYVRESEAARVKLGQTLKFSVLSLPERVFEAQVGYVTTAVDPASRRLVVRATIDNTEGVLKPEMFASVTIVTGESSPTAAVPREAVIYEGDQARVWVAREDQTVEQRPLKLGLTNGRLVQVLDGLRPGERVVTRGSLFVDRMASVDRS